MTFTETDYRIPEGLNVGDRVRYRPPGADETAEFFIKVIRYLGDGRIVYDLTNESLTFEAHNVAADQIQPVK